MKLIFLDIDGPISHGTKLDGIVKIANGLEIPYGWNQEQCDALTRIIKATDAKVIISSDWKRHFTDIEFHEIFNFYKIPQVLLGTTSTRKAKMSSASSMDRAYQIAEVVNLLKDDIDSWIAIDDYPLAQWFEDMTGDYAFITKDNAIQTIGEHSDVVTQLTEIEDKIIKHLNDRK